MNGGNVVIGFDADRTRTLVYMATDSSNMVIMGKRRLRIFSTVSKLMSHAVTVWSELTVKPRWVHHTQYRFIQNKVKDKIYIQFENVSKFYLIVLKRDLFVYRDDLLTS